VSEAGHGLKASHEAPEKTPSQNASATNNGIGEEGASFLVVRYDPSGWPDCCVGHVQSGRAQTKGPPSSQI
jgi:hypothetical protein